MIPPIGVLGDGIDVKPYNTGLYHNPWNPSTCRKHRKTWGFHAVLADYGEMPRKQPATAQKASSPKVASQPGRSGEPIER
jgi:hypothetical protein